MPEFRCLDHRDRQELTLCAWQLSLREQAGAATQGSINPAQISFEVPVTQTPGFSGPVCRDCTGGRQPARCTSPPALPILHLSTDPQGPPATAGTDLQCYEALHNVGSIQAVQTVHPQSAFLEAGNKNERAELQTVLGRRRAVHAPGMPAPPAARGVTTHEG